MCIRDQIQEGFDQSLLFADGFDDCIIGIVDDFGTIRVVYCVKKMISNLMSQSLGVNAMTYEDAMEYLEYNTFNAWVGQKTPIYMEPRECFTI